MMLALCVALAATLAGAPPGQAAAPLDQNAIEREAKEIEGLLIAPCCWTQPVSDHYSAEADQIRTEVRTMLAGGQTRAAILDTYVDRYGERILVEPRAHGVGAFLHYLPWVFFAAGGVLTVVVVRRFAGRASLAAQRAPAVERQPRVDAPPDAATAEDEDRLEDELSRLD